MILCSYHTLSPSAASSRDLLRTSGGLAYVLDLLYNSSSSPKLQQTALYTLGCAAERNRKNWHISHVIDGRNKEHFTIIFAHDGSIFLLFLLSSLSLIRSCEPDEAMRPETLLSPCWTARSRWYTPSSYHHCSLLGWLSHVQQQ